jgi:opacity protein-like surface antigen
VGVKSERFVFKKVVYKLLLKSVIYIVFSILFFTTSLNAQSTIGVFSGWNSSTFFDKGDPNSHYSANYDSDDTFIFGLYFKERKKRFFNLSLNFDYLVRNVFIDAYYGGLGSWVDRDINVNIHTINLRVLPEIKFGNQFAAYFNAGPFIGYIIYTQKSGESRYGDIDLNNYTVIESGNAKDIFKGMDFGLSASVGFEINIYDNITLNPEVSYSFGLQNIASGSIGSNSGGINSRNFYITLGVGYYIKGFNITDH